MNGHHVTLTIASARIVWGYHLAAGLVRCVVDKNDDGVWTLAATVTAADAFRLAQSGLTFEVPTRGGRAWRWPIVSLSRDGATLSARLGPQEKSHNAEVRTT